MFSEWLYLPEAAAAFLCDPGVWLFLIGGVFLGFVVGVVPGLGPTMGMALCLGLVFHLEYTHGMALLVGIFVASCGSGGITASPDQHPRHTRSSGDLSGWQRPDKAGQRPGGRRLFHCSVCCGNACGHDPYLPDPALRDWHRPEVWRLGDLSVLRFRSAHLRLYFWRQPAAGVDCRLGGVPAVSDRSGWGTVRAALHLWARRIVVGLQQRYRHARAVWPWRGSLHAVRSRTGADRGKDRLSTHQLDGLESQSWQHAPFRSGRDCGLASSRASASLPLAGFPTILPSAPPSKKRSSATAPRKGSLRRKSPTMPARPVR